jgi:hypothetical protein
MVLGSIKYGYKKGNDIKVVQLWGGGENVAEEDENTVTADDGGSQCGNGNVKLF